MMSVLFCSRARDNPDYGLPRLLDSAVEHVAPHERDKIEFLIKFDDDDTQRPPDEYFQKYPFRVRTFCWSRGEGRHALHHAQEYLFTQRDPKSRFCLMTADDFYFNRTGFVSEILAVPDEFCVLGWRRPPIESFAGVYEQDAMIRQWVVACGPWSPVVSSRLIEVCQNFGWQANVDSWLMGLSVVMYDLYRVVLWRQHAEFYARGGSYERPASTTTPRTYNNMELTNAKGPENRYWFELVRRQARNLYLNMEYGSELRKLAPAPQRLWRKLRSRPLAEWPARVMRRARRNLAALFA